MTLVPLAVIGEQYERDLSSAETSIRHLEAFCNALFLELLEVMELSIQDVGSMGEFVAAIATILTLIYLARQLQSNTKATQGSNRREITRDFVRFGENQLDPVVARAWHQGLQSYPHMANEANNSFAVQMTNQALMFQSIFAQYENGQLEEATYITYLLFFTSIIASPGGGAWWEDSGRPIFVPKMVIAVDKQLAKGEHPELMAMYSELIERKG
ncbi:MAG: hypothetical protein ABJK20_13600 [Halieaceae bacterium]